MQAQENAKFWHDKTLNNLELLRATYITHVFAPHTHEGFAIGIIERGAQTFIYRGRNRLVMPAGCVALVNPGEVHIGKATTASGWTYRMFYPEASALQAVASELFDRPVDIPFFSFPILYDNVLFQLIRHMHTVLEDRCTSQLERETLFIQVLAHLIHRHADDRPPLGRVLREQILMRQVRDFLAGNFNQNVSLQDLADQVGLSRSYLVRIFRKTYGLPPHAYQTQIRIEHAKKQLLAGLSIAEVALEAGFVDQSHLTRHFKRIVGVPPGQYRLIL